MNLHKKLRSLLFHLNSVKMTLTKVKIKVLYGDCIVHGKNFKSSKLNFEMHPDDSKIEFGDNVQIRERAVFRLGKGGIVKIEDGFFANQGLSVNAMGRITIGKNTILGENVKLYDHNHGYKNKTVLIQEQSYTIGEIEIGNNCWIGSNVVILKDVKIGDNCVIGANTLVNKDVEANTVLFENINLVSKKY